jgi:SHS2 domain-containing protein
VPPPRQHPKRPSEAPSGHRFLPHPSDWLIEAWGPDRASCAVEALRALVEGFAEVPSRAEVCSVVPLRAGPGPPDEALVSLLEEVIYELDARGLVPVRFRLAETDDGGFGGEMEAVPLEQVEVVGPAPKAVSYHGLVMTELGGSVRCQVLVDV